MSATFNANVADRLNRAVADAVVLHQKAHHFHWQVKGPAFFRLHEKFQELYERFAGVIDDVAERMIQIGGNPVPTLAIATKLSGIRETEDAPDGCSMVRQTIADLEIHLAGIRSAQAAAEEAGDRTTVNVLDEVADATEKDLWMLRAFLNDNG